MNRPYSCSYTLRNGDRGRMDVLATSSCAALMQLIDLFGESLRRCSARPGITAIPHGHA